MPGAFIEIFTIRKEQGKIYAYLAFTGPDIENFEAKTRIIKVGIDEEGYVTEEGKKVLKEIKEALIKTVDLILEESGGIKAMKQFVETASDIAEEKALVEDLKNNGLMNFAFPGTAEMLGFVNALIENLDKEKVNIFYLLACSLAKTVTTYELEKFCRNTNKSKEDIAFLEEINNGLSSDAKYAIENVEYERANIAFMLKERWKNVLKGR